jgi:cytochrome c oxidase cbb3-type subunit 3
MIDANREQKVVHVYDDIQECDNHLPNWWLYTLYGTVLFAIGYWFYFQVFQIGEQPMTAWRRENLELAERSGQNVKVTAGQLLDMSKDPSVLAEGRQVFASTCVACHASTGGGNIGPNLTDAYWIHGGAPEQIYTDVKDGWPEKGMPAWGPQLGAARVQAVTAYVLTLRNTNVPGGKPPQGDKFALAE